ncbi:MAG: 3-dehydroquinate synthase [Bacteroidales bacterium]
MTSPGKHRLEKIPVKGLQQESMVLVGEKLGRLPDYLPRKKTFVLTDKNIQRLYGAAWEGLPVFVLEPGEQSKTLETAGLAYRWLMDNGADRSSFITGIGGGMVCDLAGFVASTFLRGLDFGFVATSLLAQVDASVGGKNGVNLDGYKNIIGTFNQPRFVICDTRLLKTLPDQEIKNGMAEVVKHALIDDKSMFERLEQDPLAVFGKDQALLHYLISRSVHIKSGIVGRDEREAGERRKLNLGHTWGHAIEKTTKIPHGFAVSAGLAFSGKLSVHKGLMNPGDYERLLRLLTKLGLPVSPPVSPEEVFDALMRDKKREGDTIHFVLNRGIGKVVVESLPVEEIRAFALNGR